MKKFFCAIAVFAAISLSACQQGQTAGSAATTAAEAQPASVNIAYVNTDSLLTNYEYAKKMSDQLNGKAESARADFNQSARVFQQELAEFQRKVQNNGFLSMERAQSEQNRLQKKEQELQELNERLSADLMREQGRLTAELQDTVSKFLKEFAKDKYSLILSNNMGDNVLYSAPGIDITAEVIDALNARYAKSSK